MSERVRKAERRFEESRALADEARVLVEKLRSGAVSEDDVAIAAYGGEPAARVVLEGRSVGLEHFQGLLERIPWFSRLGKPHPRDKDVVRVGSFREIPWNAEWNALDGYAQYRHDRLFFEAGENRRAEVEKARFATYASVEQRCLARLGLIDLSEPNDPTQYGVLAAAFMSGVTAGYLSWSKEIPERLGELWRWYAEGHWIAYPFTRGDGWDEHGYWRPDEEPWRDLPPLVVF